MAKAHNAPRKRVRRLIVPDHVLTRLRERAAEEVKHRLDDDLGDLIDEAVCSEMRNERVEMWWQLDKSGEPEPLWAVDLREWFKAAHMVAVVTNDRKGRNKVVKTVLTKEQADAQIANNTWTRTPEALGRDGLHAPLLDDETKRDLNQLLKLGAERKTVLSPVTKDGRVVKIERVPSDEVLVTWLDDDGDENLFVCTGEEAARGFIKELVGAGTDPGVIRWWVPKELKLKKRVVVEFE